MSVGPLHAHQERAITMLREAMRMGSKRPMLQAPTGAGKSRIAAEIINMARAKGNRVIFCVPAIALVDQTARMFWDEGIRDVGVLQASHAMTDPSQPVQIASIQTLARRKIPEARLVLIDEAHRLDAFVTDWMGREEWAGVPFIGLSATPWTKGLGRLYDRLLVTTTTQELIDNGFLSPFRVFATGHPDLTGVKTVAGDYHEGQLSAAMRKGALMGDIVRTWLEKAERRPTLAFCVDCAHAQAVRDLFVRAGVRAGYQDAQTPGDERDKIRKDFASGALEVVCNVGTLTTGVDWDVRCVIFARPTKSEILYVQCIGRGLRTADGKADCLILDHSDTTERLGFVTDIHHDTLDDGTLTEAQKKAAAEGTEEPLPKPCPACSFMKPPAVRKCPACGHEAARPNKVEHVEGELREVTAAAKRNRNEEWGAKVEFMGSLLRYAAIKGYKSGWASNAYRERYGVFPNDPRVRHARMAVKVSTDVAKFVQSRNIARAKARERGGDFNHGAYQ